MDTNPPLGGASNRAWRWAWTAWKWVLALALIALAIALATIVLAKCVLLAVPTQVGEKWTGFITQGLTGDPRESPSYSKEVRAAVVDDYVIEAWYALCFPANDAKLSLYPDLILRPVDAAASAQSSSTSKGIVVKASTPASAVPTLVAANAVQISTHLYNVRIDLEARYKSLDQIADIGAISAIIIGFLTTVVVGIHTVGIWKDERLVGTSLRIAALVLPALGTAAAAAVAFFNPPGALARQAEALTVARAAHANLRNVVTQTDCHPAYKDLEELRRAIDSASARGAELLRRSDATTSSDPATSKPPSSLSNAPPNKPT